ncbi:MAG TPA: hypothetical protein VK524_09905 [Polyangiaceae bacterium]|nr:hypothetical protein [Polyangiaceae bacterium]
MRKYSVCAVLVATTLANAQARADELAEKQACVAAADQGQVLRDEGKFRPAREAFMRCASKTCPELVSADCSTWLVDLERRAPTVIVSAKDHQSNDLTRVQVTIDGEPLAERLDGKPLLVDIGEHAFRYQAAGFEAVEQRITIAPSDKNRVLAVRFDVDTRTTTDSKKDRATLQPTGSPSIPLPTWILGGTAVAAFASAAYFGVSGISQRSEALGADGCAPNCPASEKTSIQTKFLVADISLGVGLVSAGLATYFLLRPRETPPSAAASLSFAPDKTGGVAIFRSHF